MADRVCSECGRKLGPRNGTGICMDCRFLAKRAELARRKPCPACGKRPRALKASGLCAACDAAKAQADMTARRLERLAHENGECWRELPPQRKCHSCGRPTNNYWCQACHRKREREYGYSGDWSA